MKYNVMGHFWATVTQEIEANSPQEAADAFCLSAYLCHQCSSRVDIYDSSCPESITVTDEDGEEVLEVTP